MFKATTQGISVNVMPVYVDERSDPAAPRYFWAYRVIVTNNCGATVQLLSRYWHITDAEGKVEEVRGEGVVGLQPTLKDGEDFTYTSGCPLTTTSGIMVGTYTMMRENGETFIIDIPAFSLDLPDLNPSLN